MRDNKVYALPCSKTYFYARDKDYFNTDQIKPYVQTNLSIGLALAKPFGLRYLTFRA